MTKKNNKPSRLAQAMLETAKDMRQAGLLDEAAYTKVTMHHLGVKEKAEVEPLTGKDREVHTYHKRKTRHST